MSWLQTGHSRMMLADIYNWFTEGFDIGDLKGRQGAARGVERVDKG
jgi:hypothetical protein